MHVIIHIIVNVNLGKERKRTIVSDEIYQKPLFEYTSNNIGNDGQLLVLFQYNISDEIRLLRMYPEVFVTDTTHGTNKKKNC